MAPSGPSPAAAVPCELVLSDVDGTLVTSDKTLTAGAIAGVERLGEAGIRFAVTSGRPPRGMEMLVEPLALQTPIAAFNGGMFVDADMKVGEVRTIPDRVVGEVIELLGSAGLDVWVYCGADWLVRDDAAPHVAKEAATVDFRPTVVDSFDEVLAAADAGGEHGVAKVSGVSDDLDLVRRIEAEARERFGSHVSAARSQEYYLDVTNPSANKGAVVDRLSSTYDIDPSAIAVLGDMPNDVLMFARAGMSIAMGNADREVQRAARHVTSSNDDDGFAAAVDRFILPSLGG